jgi:hypothetical protein
MHHGHRAPPGWELPAVTDIGAIGPDLAFIIRHGAGMLDDVEDAVRRCRTDPHPSKDLAKSCGTLVSGYEALRGRLELLPPSALTGRVDRLLAYAVQMTHQASMLAFRPHDGHWDALAACFGDGRLGAAADELRSLDAAARAAESIGYRWAGHG